MINELLCKIALEIKFIDYKNKIDFKETLKRIKVNRFKYFFIWIGYQLLTFFSAFCICIWYIAVFVLVYFLAVALLVVLFTFEKIPVEIFAVSTAVLSFFGILYQVRQGLNLKNREKIFETNISLIKILIDAVSNLRQMEPLILGKDLEFYFAFLSKKAIWLLTHIYNKSRKLKTDEDLYNIFCDVTFLIYLLRLEVNIGNDLRTSFSKYSEVDVKDIICYEEREKEREEYKKRKIK